MSDETPPVKDIRISDKEAEYIRSQMKIKEDAKTVSVERFLKLKQELIDEQAKVAKFNKDIAKNEENKRQELLKTFSEEVQKEYKKATLDELVKLSKVLGTSKTTSPFVSRANAGKDTDVGSGWFPIGRQAVDGKTLTKYSDGKGNYKVE